MRCGEVDCSTFLSWQVDYSEFIGATLQSQAGLEEQAHASLAR